MASQTFTISIAWLLVYFTGIYGQTIAPSNETRDIGNPSQTPRFLLNGSEIHNLSPIGLAPLDQFANLDENDFQNYHISGHLVKVNAQNANEGIPADQFSYLSCDPADYTGNLDASDVFKMAVQNAQKSNIIILYSTTSLHCNSTDLSGLGHIKAVLTTTNPIMAASVADLNLNLSSSGSCLIYPDFNSSPSNDSNSNSYASGGPLGQPTTAVAMIILYSITGLITALFVVIIITGAIRAHRHPERYGPRNVVGRGRQSRARGIARAMLETLPIVKFGDQDGSPTKPAERTDVEMDPVNNNLKDSTTQAAGQGGIPSGTVTTSDAVSQTSESAKHVRKGDGTDDDGQLGCSICTEDFTRGEEVRVLPCNHKFHPDCVDPWLLNVSGTCPLCRIDLRPQGDEPSLSRRGSNSVIPTVEGQEEVLVHDAAGESLPPPLTTANPTSAGRRDYVAYLRHMASGSREERIAALRRVRQERPSVDHRTTEDERRGLTRRFRERFRIRTERRGSMFASNDRLNSQQDNGSTVPPLPTSSSATAS